MSEADGRLQTFISSRAELGWTELFLHDFPNADLYLVGGAVRDGLLQRTTRDFDFVVRGVTIKDLEGWFEARGHVDLVGRTFGVYKFIPDGYLGEAFDVALPRIETSLPHSQGGYREFAVDARTDLPIEMDLGRRDFTVNAMAYDLRQKKLIDPWHGLRDLEAKRLRTVGAAHDRFSEDLSRILRAMRLSCQLGFHIDDEVWQAIRAMAPRLMDKNNDGQWIVPRETIGREWLTSFLLDPTCTLIKYRDSGLASLLLPGVDMDHVIHLIHDVAGLPPRLLVSLLLSGLPIETAKDLCLHLHFGQFPKSHRFHLRIDDVVWILRSRQAVDLMEHPATIPGSIFERFFLGTLGDDLVSLFVLTEPSQQKKIAEIRERIVEIRKRLGDEIPELINGDDLIKLGVKPGAHFRKLMAAVRDQQIAGSVITKQDAIEYLQKQGLPVYSPPSDPAPHTGG